MIQAHILSRREASLLAPLVLLAILGMYTLALDQGFLLSLTQGASAFDTNLIHEVLHDARHAAGFPCH